MNTGGVSAETSSSIDRAELVAIQVALARGWLQEQDLREAVSQRARLRRGGQERGLLALVSESYLQPAQLPELRAIYEQALQVAAGDAPAERTRAHGSDVGRIHDDPTRGPQRPPSSGTHAPLYPEAPPPSRVGRYELKGELGRGGMGTVYRAYDPELGRDVALKVLGAQATDDEDRERFRREARAAGALRHPHAVRVLDLDVAHAPPFLVMELVEGESLKARLQREGPWPPRPAAELVRKLASALGAAHTLGLVHRDVKPANVLLDARDEPALTDFGLARRLDGSEQRLTRSGDVLGTPTYMSPEQARGERDVGKRSDVWSLGAVLYHLLTGRPPFLENTVLDQIKALLQRDPEPPSVLCPGLPAGLEAIVVRCVQRDPAARYPDARALEEDLIRWLEADAAALRAEEARAAPAAPTVLAPARAAGLAAPTAQASAHAPLQAAAPASPSRAPLLAAAIVGAGALVALATLLGRNGSDGGRGPSASPAPQPGPGSLVARDPGLWRAEAERLHARGATEEAIAALGSALLAAPRDLDTLCLRGELRLAGGDPRGAEVDAATALELDPHALRARRLRGRARLEQGDPGLACEDLEKAWDLSSQGPLAREVARELLEAVLAAAAAALDAGDFDALTRRLARAEELEPAWPPALQMRAEALLRDQDFARAEAVAAQGLADPARLAASGLDPGWLLWVRAQARYEQRRVQPALDDFDQALRTLPPTPRTGLVHVLRGQARLLGAGDPTGALADAERAAELIPPQDRHHEIARRLRAAALARLEGR